MTSPLCRYEISGDVGIITLDDAATLNALTPNGAAQLIDHLKRAESEARAILLTGAGRGFCSGTNLAQGAAMRAATDGPIDVGATLEHHYNPLMQALRDVRLPLVTAINGAAAGIGCSIALMGDLVVAAEKAYFLQAFCHIGLVPDGGATYALARSIGRARAMEMMLLGEKIAAPQALEWGLINRVVPAEELTSTALGLAIRLANGPTATLGLVRKMAWAALDNDFASALRAERENQKIAGQTADFPEGIAAFFERRPPKFTGK